MGDTSVDFWKLEGHLHVWHYLKSVKGLVGWHLNADKSACQSIADLAERMLGAEHKTHQRIPVSVPRNMLVGEGQEWEPATALLLCYPKDEAPDNFWHLEPQADGILTLSLGVEKMRQFKECLLGLPEWKDDFALGPDSEMHRATDVARWKRECLWFWTKIE